MSMRINIDTDALIAVAADYIYAANDFWGERRRSGYRNDQTVYLDSHRRKDDALWRAWRYMEMNRRRLDAVAEILRIDSAIIVNAARCYCRYYEHGGDKILDTGHLIEGML